MRKSISLLLSFLMVICIIISAPVTVSAASESDLVFSLNYDDETYSVSGCNSSVKGEIVIPSKYNGAPVRRIDSLAFNNCSGITSIIIPDSVTEIKYRAFSDCTSLTSITIPKNVNKIGALAFYPCESLVAINVSGSNGYFSSVDGVLFNKAKTNLIHYPQGKTNATYKVPDGVVSIADYAFQECKIPQTIIFPNSLTSIGKRAFVQCTGLTSVTFGNKIESIGESAFASSSIKTVSLPKSVKSIGEGAFVCFGNTAINVADENEFYSSVNGVLFNEAKTALIQYPMGKTSTSYAIPDTVTSIGVWAFSNCTSLEAITIPDSMKSIGMWAFCYCTGLESVTIPVSVESIDMYAFCYCTSLEAITIPDSVTSVNAYAFLHCPKVTSITIPSSVEIIGNAAFGFCLTDDDDFVKIEDFIIYGVKGSKAEDYAKAYGFTFKTACAHNSTKWVTDKKATVYKAGSKHKECNECGKILKTATIKQLKCSKPTLKSIENTKYGVLTKWGTVKGADKYRVYRKTSKTDWEYIGSTTNTYYTDKTAKSGTKYYYAIKARNEAGNSSFSGSLSKYYLADPTLNTPSTTTKGVGLRWSKVTGASGYMVYRRTTNGSYKIISTEKGVSNLTYRDTTAKKGTKYYYKVKAYKSKTYSAYSNTKTITDKY